VPELAQPLLPADPIYGLLRRQSSYLPAFAICRTMKRVTYKNLVAKIAPRINECFPWDVAEKMTAGEDLLFLDVRENQEYDTMHIEHSLHVPRGILETAVEWDHEETEPELVRARDRRIIVVCRSGSRSVFATFTLMQMGYGKVTSLKTGLRGWNEYDLPLVDIEGNRVDPEVGDKYFANKLLDYQRKPENLAEQPLRPSQEQNI